MKTSSHDSGCWAAICVELWALSVVLGFLSLTAQAESTFGLGGRPLPERYEAGTAAAAEGERKSGLADWGRPDRLDRFALPPTLLLLPGLVAALLGRTLGVFLGDPWFGLFVRPVTT